MTEFRIPEKAMREADAYVAEERLADALYRVEGGTDPEWKAAVNEALRVLLVERGIGGELTASDVQYKLESCGVQAPADFEPRALGPLMQGASRRGWLSDSGRMHVTTRASRNKGLERIWLVTELGFEQRPLRLLAKPRETADLRSASAPGGFEGEVEELPEWEISDGFIRIGKMELHRVSRGFGLVCSDCRCEVDAHVRGPHDESCSLRVSNESLYEHTAVFTAYEAARVGFS